jgi:hypothetical protein
MESSWNTLLSAPTQIRSRSINAENPDGAAGAAARQASKLGVGRKGRAFLPLASGATLTLANISGPGIIRHIWLTLADATPAGPYVLRDVILRMYWDDESDPSVEVPVGDFFCNGFGSRALVTSEPIVVAPTGGMNCYFPMPFRKGARIELESQHDGDLDAVFFQIDYTIGDDLADDTAYFHSQWRRTNGTAALGDDHTIVDGIEGAGHYVGTYIALTSLQRFWWGEGEVKFFIDDDDEYPTQVSTGLEDYAGGAWAFQDALSNDPAPVPITFNAPYFGYPHYSAMDTTKASPFATPKAPEHGLYRWHLPDPIIFTEKLRVTLQQIGAWDHGLFERSDDIASTSYWYQTGHHLPFPALPSVEDRKPR